MTLPAEKKPFAIAKNDGIEQAEAAMLNMEQVECPVAHHFGPNVYVREVTLPAGAFVVGHAHKQEHLNIMLTGKLMMEIDGQMQVLEAPMMYISKAGRKIAYVLETCVWQNIFATDVTDIPALEEMLLDKSETFCSFESEQKAIEQALRQVDRDDFALMLQESGIAPETARAVSENEKDQVPMPREWQPVVTLRESCIEGKGLFLNLSVDTGSVVAPARIDGKRTPAGRYVNHSASPNCKYVKIENGDIYLVAKRSIAGCSGGSHGEELTVDYRQALSLSGVGELTCQQ